MLIFDSWEFRASCPHPATAVTPTRLPHSVRFDIPVAIERSTSAAPHQVTLGKHLLAAPPPGRGAVSALDPHRHWLQFVLQSIHRLFHGNPAANVISSFTWNTRG
jgi:hypothetical protein